MARSDFNVVPVNHTFTVADPEFTAQFAIEGNQITDHGFLIVTMRGVSLDSHRIFINTTELDSFDLPPAPGDSQAWQTWMDVIRPDAFLPGTNQTNRLRIVRSGNDDFEVKAVVVHWRE